MSVQKFIRHNMPEPWLHVVTKHRCINETVSRIYACVPKRYKNKYHYTDGIAFLRRAFRAQSILSVIDISDVHGEFNREKWLRIDKEIKQYIEDCR